MNYTPLNRSAAAADDDTDDNEEDAYFDSTVRPLLTATTNGNSPTDGNQGNNYISNVNFAIGAGIAGNGTRASRSGITTNRRDYPRKFHQERWGRIRLGVLSICFVFLLYICFSVGIWVDGQRPPIIVNIPPMDESLPGPRGMTF